MTTVKAIKKTISVAGLPVDVFQMPDGRYQYSMASAGTAIGKSRESLSEFLGSKRPEALPYKGLPLSEVKVKGNNKPIKAVPSHVTSVYWSYWASKGDKQALALVAALSSEALDRRADAAFGETKTEAQYEEATTKLREELIAKSVELDMQQFTATKQDIRNSAKADRDVVLSQLSDEEYQAYLQRVNPMRLAHAEKAKAESLKQLNKAIARM